MWRVPRGNKQPGSLVKVHAAPAAEGLSMAWVTAVIRQLTAGACALPELVFVSRMEWLNGLQVYVSPAKQRYRTYRLAKAAFASASAEQPVSLPAFGLSAMVTWLRDVACSHATSPDQLDAAMLLGVLRARGLLSFMRSARIAAMRS